MELSTPVIIGIALLVLVLLIILVVVGVRASQKRKAQQQEADRQRAAQLREEAAQNEQAVQERDLKARETELDADRARIDAERKAKEAEQEQIAAERRHAEAEQQRTEVDQERGSVQDQLAEADRLDPDTGEGRHGAEAHDRPGHGAGPRTADTPDTPDRSAGTHDRPAGADTGRQHHGAGTGAAATGAGVGAGAAAHHGEREHDRTVNPGHEELGHPDDGRDRGAQHLGEQEDPSPTRGRRAARPTEDSPVTADPQHTSPGAGPAPGPVADADHGATTGTHEDRPLRQDQQVPTADEPAFQETAHSAQQRRPAPEEPRVSQDPDLPQDRPAEQDPFLRQEQELAQENGEQPPRAPDFGRHEDGTEHRG